MNLERPPLGLLPRWLHKELNFDDESSPSRLKDIDEAISRYKNANKQVPNEWTVERNEIIEATK